MNLGDSLQEQLAAKLGDLNENTSQDADAATSTLGRIAQLVEKVSGYEAQEVEATHSAEDLGLGSLERIEIAVRIEEAFGVRLDDRHVAELSTVGELSEYVDSQAESTS